MTSEAIRHAIIAALARGQKTAIDLARELGADFGSVKNALKVLVERCRVRRIDRPNDLPVFALLRQRASSAQASSRADRGAVVVHQRPRFGVMV